MNTNKVFIPAKFQTMLDNMNLSVTILYVISQMTLQKLYNIYAFEN